MSMRVIMRHRFPSGGVHWLRFAAPEVEYCVDAPGDVLPTMALVESVARKNRWYAVGYVSYEAAPGFDPSLVTHSKPTLPLLHFGLFSSCEMTGGDRVPCEGGVGGAAPGVVWVPTLTEMAFRSRLERVHRLLFDGDTYQVNFTFRMRAKWADDPFAAFLRFYEAQPTEYAAFIDTGRHVVISASPELFYRADGDLLTCRPMKGTAGRGDTPEVDGGLRDALGRSEKDRAENVMIVDMIRNDLGKIADPGTVAVTGLCEVEAHPTVWQMTSTVAARSHSGLAECFRALFPCASITGAPKRRTMEIIRELEDGPRGIYTGAVGLMKPDGDVCFSVAIRTLHVDQESGIAEYGIGSGVVWDSDSAAEYGEGLLKARVLRRAAGDCSLLETLLWSPARGFVWLDAHLARMRASAETLGFPMDDARIRASLEGAVANAGRRALRIRLLLGSDGAVRVETGRVPAPLDRPFRVAFARMPVRRDDVALYHKTTCRRVYEEARHSVRDVDDVVLWNEEGEVTESTIANVVVRLDGQWVTPPVRCGLLPGIFRAALVRRGCVTERVVTVSEFRRAESMVLVNSVRGIIRAECVAS